MFDSKDMSLEKKSTGDAAIDGLVAGLAGGIIGALVLLVLGLFSGISSINILQRFDATASGSALLGIVMHLAVSVIYGALFAILLNLAIKVWPAARRISWLLGEHLQLGSDAPGRSHLFFRLQHPTWRNLLKQFYIVPHRLWCYRRNCFRPNGFSH
jgi:hypothetical protein